MTDKSPAPDWSVLERKASEIVADDSDALSRLQRLCDYLADSVPHYDWFGFYFAVPRRREVILGPYNGEATEHVRIPYGRGICGQVAEGKDTLTIADVTAQENYLSCSIHVRSEIVVPILDGDEFLGEIDIDSHTQDAFSHADRALLERLATKLAPLVPRNL